MSLWEFLGLGSKRRARPRVRRRFQVRYIPRDDRNYNDPWTSDVSADHGAHAEHGNPDFRNSGRGAGPGMAGGDATPASPAQEAGEQRLRFTSHPTEPNKFNVTGKRKPADTEQEHVNIPELDSHTGRYFTMKANGGNGGHGGHGGFGEDGARGRDAWSTGARGGNGYGGGDGGLGTHGGAASDGGINIAEYDKDDTYLAGLVKGEAEGGQGGAPGTHGRGGEGGPGGRGGPGRSPQYSTRRNRDGTTTRVLVRSGVPPGSPGFSGSDGHTPTTPLHPGRDGDNGFTRHIVYDGNEEIARYRTTWELILDGFVIREGSDKGRRLSIKEHNSIFEPTEELETDHFDVHNRGEMPMSHNYPTVVHLEANDRVEPLVVEDFGKSVVHTALLHDPLKEDVPHTISGQVLPFRLLDIDFIPEDEPLDMPFVVRPRAIQTGIDRLHTSFDNPRHERMRFPCDSNKPSSMEAMEPGQMALFELQVNNRGELDVGRETDGNRDLETLIHLVTSEMSDHIMILDESGKELTANELRHNITELNAGTDTTLSVYIGVLPTATPYSGFNIQSDLELGRLYKPTERRTVLRRNYHARVAQKYRYIPDADVLLITNRDTDVTEKNAIEATAKLMGRNVNIWDISLNNELSFSQDNEHGANLLRDFHGQTIVMTNNAFETINGSRHADQFLSQMDLIRAGESHDIGLVVLNPKGHNIDSMFTLRLYPTEEQEIEYEFDSVKEFSAGTNSEWMDAEMLNDVGEMVEYHADRAKLDPTRMTSLIRIHGRFKPDKEKLVKIARKVQLSVEQANPGRRVMAKVKVNDYGERTWKNWFRKKELGTITIMPTVGDAKPNTIVLDVDEEKIHDPEFLKGKAFRTALAQGMSFDKLMEKLVERIKLLQEDSSLLDDDGRDREGELLVDTLLAKIAIRQASMQKAWMRGKISPEQLRKGMQNLQTLRDDLADIIPTFFISDDKGVTNLLARLVAGLQFLGKSQGRWSRFLLGFRGWFRAWQVRDETLRVAKYLKKKWFSSESREEREIANAALELHRDEFRNLRLDKREDNEEISIPHATRQSILHSILKNGIRMDALESVNRIIMEDEWREICRREADHIQDRLELADAKAQNQAKYLVVDEGKVIGGKESHPTNQFVDRWEAERPKPTPITQKSAPVQGPHSKAADQRGLDVARKSKEVLSEEDSPSSLGRERE